VMALENLDDYLKQTGRHLLISGSNPDVTRVLENSGLIRNIGRENIFPADVNPTVATRHALERAKQLLPGQKLDVRIFYDKDKAPAT
jgi:SulP family sulfate permease